MLGLGLPAMLAKQLRALLRSRADSAAPVARPLPSAKESASEGLDELCVWLCICTAELCRGSAAAQAAAHAASLPRLLARLLASAPKVEVRAAAIHAMRALSSLKPTLTDGEPADGETSVSVGASPLWRLQLGAAALPSLHDASALVRAQLCGLLGTLSVQPAHRDGFGAAARELARLRRGSGVGPSAAAGTDAAAYLMLVSGLSALSHDPLPRIRVRAGELLALLQSDSPADPPSEPPPPGSKQTPPGEQTAPGDSTPPTMGSPSLEAPLRPPPPAHRTPPLSPTHPRPLARVGSEVLLSPGGGLLPVGGPVGWRSPRNARAGGGRGGHPGGAEPNHSSPAKGLSVLAASDSAAAVGGGGGHGEGGQAHSDSHLARPLSPSALASPPCGCLHAWALEQLVTDFPILTKTGALVRWGGGAGWGLGAGGGEGQDDGLGETPPRPPLTAEGGSPPHGGLLLRGGAALERGVAPLPGALGGGGGVPPFVEGPREGGSAREGGGVRPPPRVGPTSPQQDAHIRRGGSADPSEPPSGAFERLCTISTGETQRCSALVLHGDSQPILVAASAREQISVWNVKPRAEHVQTFLNGNPPGTRCTSLLLLSDAPHEGSAGPPLPLLAVGSSEGAVRVWRAGGEGGEGGSSAANAPPPTLLGCWQGAAAPADTSLRECKLSMSYQCEHGVLTVAGGCGGGVNLWDVRQLRCKLKLKLPLPSGEHSTSLCADQRSPLLVCGASDGVVRTIDPRLAPSSNVVASFECSPQRSPIVSLSLQPGGALASGSLKGEIMLIEQRRGRSLGQSQSAIEGGVMHAVEAHKASLSSLCLHPSTPLMASGSRNQFIKLFDTSRVGDEGVRELNTIRYFDGFLGARIAPVTCLSFHPTKLILASGSTDAVISLFAPHSP